MGNDVSKRDAIALIAHPENKEELERLFKSFDKDKSGSLDAKEWKAFGKLLWEVDVDEAHAQGQNERRQAFMAQAGVTPPPGIPSWMLSGRQPFNNNGFGLNKIDVKPHDVDAWIADMFKLADKDGTGSITFTEFYTFLQTDSKQEAAKQKDHAVVAIADPLAAQQARMNTPGAAIGRDMAAGIMGALGVQVAPNSQADQLFHPAPYVPGEMTSAHRQAVNASPEMSALYQKNPALVNDFFTHQYTDPQRCQRLLAENPELAAASNAMQMQMMQQRMAMQAQMGGAPFAAPLPGGGY